MTQPAPEPQPVFDPNAPHMQRPRLRPVRLFPANVNGQMALGISDARQISERMVVTSPAAQGLLGLLDGSNSLDAIVQQVGRGLTRPILEQLVAQLDDACLLAGPKYDALRARVHHDFDASPTLPPASTAAFADALAQQVAGSEEAWNAMSEEQRNQTGAKRMREVFDEWMSMALKDAEKPSLDALPAAVIAPHLDYQRGWINYGSVYGRLRVVDRPDRVVILGTNHFGEGTGVVGCDKGYQTPLGVCAVDERLLADLRSALGPEGAERLMRCRFDHEREHSIELQIPWLQHVFGRDEAGNYPRVFGALVHDPAANNGESYDGTGLGFAPFVEALGAAIGRQPGRTLIVSSADLSHAGPAFGDQQALAGDSPEATEARNTVFRHDHELIKMIIAAKPDELIASMSWQGNPTRWCSLGNITAALRLSKAQRVEIFNYAGSMDEQGTTLVTSISGATA
jgi:predicted class III extradiol MEMO1 family dioxygenase